MIRTNIITLPYKEKILISIWDTKHLQGKRRKLLTAIHLETLKMTKFLSRALLIIMH